MRHEPTLLTKARIPAAEPLAREVGVVVHHQHVGKAVAGPQAHVANDKCSVRLRLRQERGDCVHFT